MQTSSDLPRTMTAVAIERPGGPEVLVPLRCEVPAPREREVLIRVHAAGVNRPDVLQRSGAYPPPAGASPLPGLEVAGEVVATGAGVRRWAAGDRVTALAPGGGYAEYCRVHEGSVLPLPAGFGFVEAAAIPETFFTVWHNVFQRGTLAAGEWLLVHGGSSGIGTTAIQLALAFGARVIATAGSAVKCDACRRLGAEAAINYREQDFVAAVREVTGGRGADVILDMVGGDYVDRNFDAAAPDGRVVQIALLAGARAEANWSRLLVKRLTHTGSTLRPRSDAFKAELAAELQRRVWPLLATGQVAPVIDSTHALADASAAHRRMEAGEHIGKLVLTVS